MQQLTLKLPRRLSGFTLSSDALELGKRTHAHSGAAAKSPLNNPSPCPPPVLGRRTPLAWLIRCCCLTRTQQSPRGAIQSRRARPSWLAKLFLPLTKAKKQQPAALPRSVVRPPAPAAVGNGDRSVIAPPVQPITRIMQRPHHDWPCVSDERKLVRPSQAGCRGSIRFWNSKRARERRSTSTG